MAVGLIQAVTALLSMCSKHMSRAARSLASPRKKRASLKETNRQIDSTENFDGQDGVWRRSILMGEKCQPLDFSGVIYYDAEGNKLDSAPPRTPMRSPLRSFGQHASMLHVN